MAISVWVHWAEALTTNEDNLMYWMCRASAVHAAACWFLSNHFPTSFQLLTLEKCALLHSVSVSGGIKCKLLILHAELVGGWQWREGGMNLADQMPPSTESSSARVNVVGEWNNGALLQRTSSWKLPYLWLLFSLSSFSFLSLPTWHWCDAINSWEESLSVSCDWQYDLLESVRRIYPSTVITPQFEQRDCFSCTRSPFPFNWLCDEQLKKKRRRRRKNKSDCTSDWSWSRRQCEGKLDARLPHNWFVDSFCALHVINFELKRAQSSLISFITFNSPAILHQNSAALD